MVGDRRGIVVCVERWVMGDENRGGVRHRWAALGVPGMGCLTELCHFVPRSFVWIWVFAQQIRVGGFGSPNLASARVCGLLILFGSVQFSCDLS